MGVEAVIATQVIDTTTVGRSVMTAANAAAALSALGAQASLVSGTNIKTVNGSTILGSGDLTVSGLTGTGSVDNAALRADGAGGATLQSSAWIINDNLTASPNNTVNHACLEATGGTTNVSVSIKPKGTGAFCLAAPDGLATGGNARGANAVDLQTLRSAAHQVASGEASFIVASQRAIASGQGAVVFASYTSNAVTASGTNAVAFAQGDGGGASGACAVAFGNFPGYAGAFAAGGNSLAACGARTASAATFGKAFGGAAYATRYGEFCTANGYFADLADAQSVLFVLRRKTTNATPTTLMLDGSSTRLTIPSGKVLSAICRICGIKSDGSAVANYVRRVVIKNVGGTTSLVGSVETIGTDIEDNASTDVTITADNTNDALQIDVTGITSETWRWVSVVEGLEVAYGT